jgi:hypothetical protein
VNENNHISQEDFVREWFRAHPDRDIPHLESKPLIEQAWLEQTGSRIEDVDRAIRRLAEFGELTKVSKGVYRLASEAALSKSGGAFSEFTSQAALERDVFCCTICHEPSDHKRDVHVVPVTAFELGGSSLLSNARTVCSFHKVALELLDKGGNISSVKVRNTIDRIFKSQKAASGSGLVLAEEMLRSLESHVGASGVNWREIA